MLHITKIRPLRTNVLTTANVFEDDMTEGGMIIARKGDLKLWQTVVAVGEEVNAHGDSILVGDKVMISPARFTVKKYSANSIQNDMDNNPTVNVIWPFVTVDDESGNPQRMLLLGKSDIEYVFDGEETEDIYVIKPEILKA